MPTPSPSHGKTQGRVSAEADRPGGNVRRIHAFDMDCQGDEHEGVSNSGVSAHREAAHLRGGSSRSNNTNVEGGNELEALVNGTGGSSTALPSPRRLPCIADDEDEVAKSAPFAARLVSIRLPNLSFRAQVIVGFVGVFFILVASALVGRYPVDDTRQGGVIVPDEAVDSCPPSAVEDIDTLLAKVNVQSRTDRCYNNDNDNKGRSRGTKSCRCSNPLVAPSYTGVADWNRGFLRNVELAREAVAKGRKLDVVMLGDSIVEYWQSTYMGSALGWYETNHEVYQRLFDSPDAPTQGLALGVAGDRCNQLLYRIQNGIIEGLHPKVFWVLIGTNDVLGSACDADQVVAGNVAILRELQKQRPNATVVVQALLPVGDSKAIVLPEVYAEIIRRLACVARGMTGGAADSDTTLTAAPVEFVNVTELFLTPNQTVNETLLPDQLHPSADGSEVWGHAIVSNVLRIIT